MNTRTQAMRYLLLLCSFLLVAGCQAETTDGSTTAEVEVDKVATPTLSVTLDRPPDSTVARLFREAMDYAREENLHTRPIGEIMQAIGAQFLGKPYAAGMLDALENETLIVALDKYDCVTFVETALAMARGIAVEDYSYETFARNLREERYRSGRLDGYLSRLHYFSEWIADNERRGLVENITEEAGGEPLDKTINFMSQHRESYPRFAEDDSVYQGIQEMEASLQEMTLYYIPQDRIGMVYDQLRAGDIIATATDIEGLDVTHTGLVYKHDDGRTGFLHASLTDGVTVSPDLQGYIQNNKRQIGIVVARPVAVNSEQ